MARWPQRRASRVLVAWLALGLSGAAPALAQETGGSLGGSDWSEPSEPTHHAPAHHEPSEPRASHERGPSSGASPRPDEPRPRSQRDRDDDAETDLGMQALGWLLVVAIGIVVLGVAKARDLAREAYWSWKHPPRPVPEEPPVPYRAPGSVDVCTLRIALDWRARRVLQDMLATRAAAGVRNDRAQLRALLLEVTEALGATKLAWLYAGAATVQGLGVEAAKRRFASEVADARARFREELVRAHDGVVVTGEATTMRPRAEDGEGVVVVTIVLAARRDLGAIDPPLRVASIEGQLWQLRRTAEDQLLALEIVWTPAAESDRMSTLELEVRHPDLVRLHEDARLGRTFCAHCRGPFAAELPRCPHCGAAQAQGS